MRKSLFLFICIISVVQLFGAVTLIDNGILDLRQQDFSTNELYVLNGEVPLYWKKQLQVDQLSQNTPSAFIRIPGIWNGTVVNSTQIEGLGFGTIAVKILLPHTKTKEIYALKIGTILSSYSLYVDSTLIKEVGIARTTANQTKSDYDPSVCYTPPIQDSFTLIMHISNFEDMKGGPWQPISIGSPTAANDASMYALIYEVFFIALFLIFSFINITNYHLLKNYDRRFKAILHLAVFTLFTALRTGLTGERILYQLFPTIPLDIMLLVEYLTFFFSVSFYHRYIHTLFQKWSADWYANFLTYTAATLSILAILTPISFYSHFIPLFQVITLITILYHVSITIRAYKSGAFESAILAFGSLAFLITATLDLMRDHTMGVSIPLIPFGASLVVITQAILILRNNKKIFKHNFTTTEALIITNSTLERFVPRQFFQTLKKDALTIQLGDHAQKKMTVLFCDIRNFSSISEHMTSNDTFRYINRYLAILTPIIQKNNGFIDKFIGDAVVALFPNSPKDAANASCEIQQVLHSTKLHDSYDLTSSFKIGIGLHYATMTLGIIGDESRMDGTVMGDAVNTASRIEQLTKLYGVDTIISKDVLLQLKTKDTFGIRLLEEVTIRGKNEHIALYELYSKNISPRHIQQRDASRSVFEQGVDNFAHDHYEEAKINFEESLTIYSDDPAAQYYLSRCAEHIS